MAVGDSELQGYDEAQKEMMNENCIIVDENDKITGQDSKINCHLGNGKLHRAFSVLIFNSNEKLLIQQKLILMMQSFLRFFKMFLKKTL